MENMNLHGFVAFLIYVLINAFTPGPGNILVLNTMTNYGWKRGKRLFLGVFLGYFTVQTICGIFTFALGNLLPVFLSGMRYVGIVYITWLAIHIARSKPQSENEGKKASFLSGFMLQLVNVKIYLFGITAISSYVAPYSKSFISILLAEGFIATVGTIASLTWIFAGKIFQKTYMKHFKLVNIILGFFLMICVVSLIKEH